MTAVCGSAGGYNCKNCCTFCRDPVFLFIWLFSTRASLQACRCEGGVAGFALLQTGTPASYQLIRSLSLKSLTRPWLVGRSFVQACVLLSLLDTVLIRHYSVKDPFFYSGVLKYFLEPGLSAGLVSFRPELSIRNITVTSAWPTQRTDKQQEVCP